MAPLSKRRNRRFSTRLDCLGKIYPLSPSKRMFLFSVVLFCGHPFRCAAVFLQSRASVSHSYPEQRLRLTRVSASYLGTSILGCHGQLVGSSVASSRPTRRHNLSSRGKGAASLSRRQRPLEERLRAEKVRKITAYSPDSRRTSMNPAVELRRRRDGKDVRRQGKSRAKVSSGSAAIFIGINPAVRSLSYGLDPGERTSRCQSSPGKTKIRGDPLRAIVEVTKGARAGEVNSAPARLAYRDLSVQERQRQLAAAKSSPATQASPARQSRRATALAKAAQLVSAVDTPNRNAGPSAEHLHHAYRAPAALPSSPNLPRHRLAATTSTLSPLDLARRPSSSITPHRPPS